MKSKTYISYSKKGNIKKTVYIFILITTIKQAKYIYFDI